MKKIFIMVVLIGVCFFAKAQTKIIWTCPMHPEVQMNKPGHCPKCGMTLVKKTITVKKTVQQKPKASNQPSLHEDRAMPIDTVAKDTTKQMYPDQMQMNMSSDTIKPKMQMSDTSEMSNMDMEGMNMDEPMDHHMSMSNVYSLNLPMGRNGSGTSWLPDASPMYGSMFHTPKWMYMLHYNLFIRYNNQDFTNKGSRGNNKIDAPDWLMLMAQHQVGQNGLFHYNVMASLDALTGSNGYPLLFQSGEAYQGNQSLTGSTRTICFQNYL